MNSCGDCFLKAEKEKVNTYFLCLYNLMAKYSVDDGEISSVVLGSRGAITPKTIEILREHGVTKSEMNTIVMNVLRSSIEMCNVFLDG